MDVNKFYFKSAIEKYISFGFLDESDIQPLDLINNLLSKIKSFDNFSLMRFNDGEWGFAYNIEPFVSHRLKITKRESERNKLIESGKILKNIIQSKPEYLISIDNFSKTRFEDIIFTNSRELNLVNGGIFNLWCMYRGFEELFEVFNQKNVLLVGPEMLEKLPFKKNHIITNKSSGVYDLETPKNEVIEYLNKNFEENMIIIYSCSFIAKYCIDEVYKIYKTKLTQLDMGASLNPYISFNNRPWFTDIIHQLNKEDYYTKNNIEYTVKTKNIFD